MQNPTLQYEREGNIAGAFAHANPSFSLSETALSLLHVQIHVYPIKLNSARAFIRAFILQLSGAIVNVLSDVILAHANYHSLRQCHVPV